MQSKHSNPTVSSSNPSTQASAFSAFKFNSIGHNPSLLERMSDGPRVSIPLRPSDQNSSQEQNSASHTPFRPNQAMGAPLVKRGSSVKPIVTQDLNIPPPTSTSLSPSDPPNDVKTPRPLDQIRASVIPELQYPNPTPEIKSPHWESSTTHSQPHVQPVPMDHDTSHQPQPPVPRTLPAPASSAPVGPGVAGGETTNSPTLSSQTTPSQHSSLVASSTEPGQLRGPVEDLFKLASAREEGLLKRCETFDLRSGELSTFGTDASRAIQDLQDRIETLKQHAEQMRVQAELTLREANKMHDMADHLIVSAGTLGVEMLGAKTHVGRAVERSEKLTRFVRKNFDWLATLRGREQEKIAVIQAEIAEQERAELERAELLRRQQELQQQLERRRIEEQEKLEAAKREEEAQEAARKKAEEEREAARKAEEEREVARKAEEEREAARRKSYEIRRAEVMAEKRRATEAQAQSIQAERERRVADTSSSISRPSIRGSNAPLSTSPASTPEVAHSARASTDVPFQQATVPTPSRSPIARTGGSSETPPPFSCPQPLPNRVKTIPAHVSFVPAQTEAGRAVNTDSPLSSTILASELHPRNVVEAHPHSSQIMRDLAEERMQLQRPSQAAPTLETCQVEIKREPSVGELPPLRSQPLQDTVNTDHSRDQPAAVSRTPSQDRNMDQQALPSSTSGSRATSLLAAQAEDNRYRMGVSAQDDLYHLNDSLHDRVVPRMDGRAYARQRSVSVSSDRSVPPWNYRRSRSPLSSRDDRPRSPSPSLSPPPRRKRTRSRTPPRFGDHWEPDRSRIRPRVDDDRDRTWRYSGYERARQGDSPHRYWAPPQRYNNYRPSPSPPPSPRQFRNERSPPRRIYYDRLPVVEHVPQRYADTDAREWRADDHRTNVNAQHHGPAYEGAEAYRTVEKEQQQRLPQHQWQRRSSSPSERDQTSTSSPRHGEVDIGLLERINMNETDNRGRGRGRPPPGAARGGANTRRGTRGGPSGGRGRGSAPAPALLSRMSETATRPARPAPVLSLSDRMGQD